MDADGVPRNKRQKQKSKNRSDTIFLIKFCFLPQQKTLGGKTNEQEKIEQSATGSCGC